MTTPGALIASFPSTHRSWFETQLTQLSEGSEPERAAALTRVRALLFERYRAPLCAYVQASRLRHLGDPDELVHGYFVKLLESCAGLHRWIDSGRPLRRWLLTGLLFHARGIARDAGRTREIHPLSSGDATLGIEASAERAFERAWCRELVEHAYAAAADSMDREGRATQWEVFRRHVIDGQPYAAIARDFGLSLQQCADATRAALAEVRRTLRTAMIDEGVSRDDLSEDQVLRSLLDEPIDRS